MAIWQDDSSESVCKQRTKVPKAFSQSILYVKAKTRQRLTCVFFWDGKVGDGMVWGKKGFGLV